MMKPGFSANPLPLMALVVGAVFIADQMSKWAILESFRSVGSQMTPLTPFLNLVLVFNPGISFGLFGDHSLFGPYAFTAFALLVTLILIVWAYKTPDRLSRLYLSFVIGGALGNVVDRIRWGAVVDFIDLHALGYHWPAFNLADSAITSGVAALLLNNLFKKPESGK